NRGQVRDLSYGAASHGRSPATIAMSRLSQEELMDTLAPAEKVKSFPTTPGVYLMKDASGVVLYVGKAKNLRNRTSHYFTKAATEDHRTADLVRLIADVDYV